MKHIKFTGFKFFINVFTAKVFSNVKQTSETAFVLTGGQVVEKSPGLACCGSEELGTTYVRGEQVCCSWWFTGEYAVYDNNNEV